MFLFEAFKHIIISDAAGRCLYSDGAAARRRSPGSASIIYEPAAFLNGAHVSLRSAEKGAVGADQARLVEQTGKHGVAKRAGGPARRNTGWRVESELSQR